MVKSSNPTLIGAGAVHLDGALLASQRRLRSAIFSPCQSASARARSSDFDEIIRATRNVRSLFQVTRMRMRGALWIELGIICAAIVRRRRIYSQKFSRALNFLIAAVIEFFQADPGTRKRRIAECFGSLG
jgi:hypothetical protein